MSGWRGKAIAAFFAWFPMVSSGPSQVPTGTRVMSIGLARQILTAALKSKGLNRRPAFDLEYYDGKDPAFYFFEATWDTPRTSVSSGHAGYAVNRVTGDVWDALACERLTSKAAENLKLRVRKWMNIGPVQYKEAESHSPCP